MVKTEYLGYRLDTIEWNPVKLGFNAWYIDMKNKHMIEGYGKKLESACADAQKKIQKKVNDGE
jgi:hypothetical protein